MKLPRVCNSMQWSKRRECDDGSGRVAHYENGGVFMQCNVMEGTRGVSSPMKFNVM